MKRSLIGYISLVTLGAIAVIGFTIYRYGFPAEAAGFDFWAGVSALVVLTIAAEAASTRFSGGRALLSISLIPMVAMVPIFGPSIAIVASAASQALARFGLLKQPVKKSLFNAAQLTMAIGLGGVVYTALGGPIVDDGGKLVAAILPLGGLIASYFLTNTALVSVVIALDTGKGVRQLWTEFAPLAFVNDLASSSFSLFVILAFAELQVWGLLLVLLPLLFVHHSYGISLQLQKQNQEILELLVKTIEAKDPYTSGHSQRVAQLSRDIAQMLGVKAKRLSEIESAALLHDIGKIDFAYSDFIKKPAALSEQQKDIMRSHPERGANLIASLSSLSQVVVDGVQHHHEHFDGNGYPEGLSGKDIPLPARIIMVADTIDAMLSHRPYRSALTPDVVRDELKRFSGRQFDPEIVTAVLETDLVERAEERAKSQWLDVEEEAPQKKETASSVLSLPVRPSG